MEYGKQLNPECSLRTPKGIKGTRQKVIVTHNPSEIDQAQELLVRFPNLGSDDAIIPGTANLSFNIELTSAVDANRMLVSNIGTAIIKKLAVKFEGNEIMSVDNFDVLACYQDLWKTKSEKRNNKKRSHTQLHSRKQVTAFQDRKMLSDKASSLLMGARKTALN